MKSDKQDAILALMRAAHDCPSRVNTAAFDEYQNRIMEPIRQDIRRAALEAAALHMVPADTANDAYRRMQNAERGYAAQQGFIILGGAT